jgi:hypothetical protein
MSTVSEEGGEPEFKEKASILSLSTSADGEEAVSGYTCRQRMRAHLVRLSQAHARTYRQCIYMYVELQA